MPKQESLNQPLAFLNSYEHAKSLFHPFILEIQSILELGNLTSHSYFWPCSPKKLFDQLLIIVNLYQHMKNQFLLFLHFYNSAHFRILWPDWPRQSLTISTPIFDHAQPKNSSFKNPAVWMTERIWGYISETRFFPNMENIFVF